MIRDQRNEMVRILKKNHSAKGRIKIIAQSGTVVLLTYRYDYNNLKGNILVSNIMHPCSQLCGAWLFIITFLCIKRAKGGVRGHLTFEVSSLILDSLLHVTRVLWVSPWIQKVFLQVFSWFSSLSAKLNTLIGSIS